MCSSEGAQGQEWCRDPSSENNGVTDCGDAETGCFWFTNSKFIQCSINFIIINLIFSSKPLKNHVN